MWTVVRNLSIWNARPPYPTLARLSKTGPGVSHLIASAIKIINGNVVARQTEAATTSATRLLGVIRVRTSKTLEGGALLEEPFIRNFTAFVDQSGENYLQATWKPPVALPDSSECYEHCPGMSSSCSPDPVTLLGHRNPARARSERCRNENANRDNREIPASTGCLKANSYEVNKAKMFNERFCV